MTPTKIAVYDFDGTLFRSPEKPDSWAEGWWGNPVSLNPPVVPEAPGVGWWNASVVQRAKEDIASDEVFAVMVTGRLAKKFTARVKDLLAHAGLKFDRIYLAPGGDTESYKLRVIGDLIKEFPTVTGVDIWEDRAPHLAKFSDFVESKGRAAFPHLITVSAQKPEGLPSAAKVAGRYLAGGFVASRDLEAAARLYHISGWGELSDAEVGDTFTLKPRRQNAEGLGVYFSEGAPVKVTTAEGTAQSGATAVVETGVSGTAGWWRTKPSIARKFNRPITWHTDGKSLSCKVESVGTIPVSGTGILPLLKSECSFSRVAAKYHSKKKIETQGGDEATVYGYSERQIANRNRDKAERVEHLRNHITDLRARVKDDLKSDDPMTRMTALAVTLMDHTCERVGNDDSADDGHYGVTVWEAGHVSFGKGKATIKYVGKSGADHEKTVDDGPTVTALKELCEGRGKGDALFDTDDAKVSADDVNDYLAEFDVTAKDIRGFRANDEMCKALRAERAKGPKDLPRSRKEKDEILGEEFKRALETVAEIVGHTESILRSSYLVPGLEDAYTHDGTVLKSLKVGTKTEAQREDEATEKLVKPSPKKKPPRHDLRNERVEVEKDPDLDDTDDDLSLNFKKVARRVLVAGMAARVATRYLWAKGAKPSEDDAEAEFLEYVKDKRFKTPKSKKKNGVSYSHLKKVDPEAAKEEREKFVPKGGKKDDADKNDADKAAKEKEEAEEKKRKEEAAKPSTPEEITDSVERIGKTEASKAMSEDDREGLSSLLSSVMEGQSRENNAKLETQIKKRNERTVEKLKGGTDRKAVDALRKVPEGLYGKGVKMTTFDSKKSSAALVKKQKARDKIQKDLEQAKRDKESLPSEIERAKDEKKVKEQELKDEQTKLEGLKEGTPEHAEQKSKMSALGEDIEKLDVSITDGTKKKEVKEQELKGEQTKLEGLKKDTPEHAKQKSRVSALGEDIKKLDVSITDGTKKKKVKEQELKGEQTKLEGLKEGTPEHTKQKLRVSTLRSAIKKLDVSITDGTKKKDAAEKRLPALEESMAKETSELNAMTAYHVSQEHLSSRLSDMSSLKSDSPKDRLSEAAKHLQALPPEMRDKSIERSKARRDEKKKELDNASDEERAALQKEVDLADAELAAGTHDKYLRMDEREAEDDNKASFIRTLHGAGVGADDEYVRTLLQEGSSQKDVAKAVHNLVQKMPKGALAQREFGDTYETFKSSPNLVSLMQISAVESLISEFGKGKKKGKADKAKADKAKADNLKALAEAAKTEDLTDEQRKTVKKVVREKAKDLPAADRETVEDIFDLDIPDASTAPKGDQKEKGPSSPGEYREMLLEGAGDEEARQKIKDLSSEELNERFEKYKAGKTSRLDPRRLATRFLSYSRRGR